MTFGISVFFGRLLLTGAFIAAASAKLGDPAGARRALRDFEIPARLVPFIRLLLPAAELAIAAALLFRATAFAGGVAGSLLLTLFAAVLGRNLARGRRPACHCFGRLDSKPIGWQTIARTVTLAAIALLVVAAGTHDIGPGVLDWLAPLAPFQRVEALASLAALALLALQNTQLANLQRQHRTLVERFTSAPAPAATPVPAADVAPAATASEGQPFRWPSPRVGSPAPAFSLQGLDGVHITLDALRARGKRVALLFTDAACGPCRTLLADVARWQRDESALTLAVISRGDADANRALAHEHGVKRLLLQGDHDVSSAYGAVATPSAVVVNADGSVGSDMAAGLQDIANLIGRFAPDTAAVAAEPLVMPDAPPVPFIWGGPPKPPGPPVMLPADARPAKDACVHDELLLDGTMVLYNRCHQQVLTLNATGALVWESCDGSRGMDAIAAEVREVFAAAPGIERDVHDVLETLLQARMISVSADRALSPGAVPAASV